MSKIKTRAARARARSFKSIQSVTGTWNPGKVRDTMPRVRTRVTVTASPHSHHSRPSMFPMGTGEVVEGRVFSTFLALLFMQGSVAWVVLILFCINGTKSYESKCTHEIEIWPQGIGRKGR